jgi:hypothetical protein
VFRTSIAALIVAALATTAPAQDVRPGDDSVQKLLLLALNNIGRGLCENNKPCAPATDDERASPPITIAEARLVVQRGALSAAAEHCGLDWRKRNFIPMMAYWRQVMKKNERQLTLIAILHGMTMEFGKLGFKDACTEQMREGLDRQMTFRP